MKTLNQIAQIVSQRIGMALMNDLTVDWFRDLTILDYDPLSPDLYLDNLPCLVVDFTYPEPTRFESWDQGAQARRYLAVKLYVQLGEDGDSRETTLALRDGIDIIVRTLKGTNTLWGTADSFELYTERIENMPVEGTNVTAILARFGWVTAAVIG